MSDDSLGTFLPARRVWERYGVTSMTLYRWTTDERLAFPRPMVVGERRFWRIADLESWEVKQTSVRPRASKTKEAV